MARIGLCGGVGKAPVMFTDAMNALISSGACGGDITGENASLLPYHLTRVSVGSRRACPKMFRPSGWKPTSSTAVLLMPRRRTVCARFCTSAGNTDGSRSYGNGKAEPRDCGADTTSYAVARPEA